MLLMLKAKSVLCIFGKEWLEKCANGSAKASPTHIKNCTEDALLCSWTATKKPRPKMEQAKCTCMSLIDAHWQRGGNGARVVTWCPEQRVPLDRPCNARRGWAT